MESFIHLRPRDLLLLPLFVLIHMAFVLSIFNFIPENFSKSVNTFRSLHVFADFKLDTVAIISSA